jgi:hypothetical protein
MLTDTLQILKRIIPSPLRPVVNRLVPMPFVISQIHDIWKRTDPSNWPLSESSEKQGIERYEYSLFSQNGEDGILPHRSPKFGGKSQIALSSGDA